MLAEIDWSEYVVEVIGGLTVVAIVGLVAWLRSDRSQRFRRLARRLPDNLISATKWLSKRWRYLLVDILLILIEVALYCVSADWKIVAFSLVHLALIGGAAWLATPRRRIADPQVIYGDALTILSGEVGEFSHSRDGPWLPSVVCSPVHPAWDDINGAKWVWIKQRPSDEEAQRGQTVWHRLKCQLAMNCLCPVKATLSLMVDDWVRVFINGELARKIGMAEGVVTVNVTPYLRPGNNVIEMEIKNEAYPQENGLSNPTGIIYRLDIL